MVFGGDEDEENPQITFWGRFIDDAIVWWSGMVIMCTYIVYIFYRITYTTSF